MSIESPTSPTSISAPELDQAVEEVVPSETSGSWVPIAALLALVAWIAAGWSSLAQKMSVDRMIKDSYDISAVQIQQLNGSLTAHVLVALVLALGATIPLLVAMSARTSSLLHSGR